MAFKDAMKNAKGKKGFPPGKPGFPQAKGGAPEGKPGFPPGKPGEDAPKKGFKKALANVKGKGKKPFPPNGKPGLMNSNVMGA
jgi:hypothetical protein